MSSTSRDILTAFEPLKNHEIFTPIWLAQEMLDQLPSDVWKHPEYKFLDPATKSGVFLREIYFRLFDSLAGMGKFRADDGKVYDLDDPKQRTNHILRNMIYGISYSEITGYVARRTLYGVRKASTDKQTSSLDSFMQSGSFRQWSEDEKSDFIGRNKYNDYYDHTMFNTPDRAGYEQEGNIFYPAGEVAKIKDETSSFEIEDKFYPFMSDTQTEHKFINQIKEGKMKFDVIIGNPPYQENTNKKSFQAVALYQHFIAQAISLNPRYLSMIVPARWYAGGMGAGMDEFRKSMLADKRLKKLVDFPEASDCFKGVEIGGGICYFLWDAKHGSAKEDACTVVNMSGGRVIDQSIRRLDKYDVFIRSGKAISILDKVLAKEKDFMSSMVSAINPFNLPTNFADYKDRYFTGAHKLYRRGGAGWVHPKHITKNNEWVGKWKVLLAKAHLNGANWIDAHVICGKPIVAEPNSVCTMTYLVLNCFDDERSAINLKQYASTKFFRFLLGLRKNTQDISREKMSFVPALDMNQEWTDEQLYARYGLTKDEIAYIEATIKPMGSDEE